MAERRLSDDVLSEVSGGAAGQMTVIGYARVITTNLNIRSAASKNSSFLGQTNAPDQHNVYQIVQNEGYVWYMIDVNKWIANDGTWVKFISK